jgi:hypothetical protein
MRRLNTLLAGGFIISLLFFLMPVPASAQTTELKPGAPPVEQPLVSEGDFALSLADALDLVTTEDEVEAESSLGELGIAPRNGWIADYPVTPDIVLELKNATATAADANKLEMSKGEALQAVDDVASDYGITVRPFTAGTFYEPSAASCANYPNPVMIEKSYTAAGTPVVTYYCPPPAYYNMYVWVPSPFWWSDLWFPGFFILRDFNRAVHVHDRVVIIRNHFNDVRGHRAFRIDPVDRFRGRTFGGIGVSRPRDFISTGVPRGERVIFNAPRPGRASHGGSVTMPSRGSEPVSPSRREGGRGAPRSGGGEERQSPRSGGGGSRR